MTKSRQNKNDRKRQRRKDFSHGRDRQTTPQDQRSPHPLPGDTGRVSPRWARTALPSAQWRTLNQPHTFDLSPGAINAIDPGVTMADIYKVMQDMQQAIMDTYLYGQSPPMIVPQDFFDPIPRPDLKREMKVGEIVGYRCWLLTPEGLLRSVYQTDIWRPGVPLTGRELGDWDSRGIHAWKDPASERYNDYIRDYLRKSRIGPRDYLRKDKTGPHTIITGTIHLWGDVVEHEHGYRGEYASVRSIDWIYPNAEYMSRERETLFHLREMYKTKH